MQCPVCDGRLREIEKSGVNIDICPSCKGIWLDKGELEKIIAQESGSGEAMQSRDRGHEDRRDNHHDDKYERRELSNHDSGRDYDPRRKKRGGFMDIFGDLLGGD